MTYCLIPDIADSFLQLLKSGKIDVLKMADMSSEQRRAYLSQHLGDIDAKEVNALYEKKLLLKNQQKAMIDFIKESSGMTEPVKRDLVTRVTKMENILDPKSLQEFKQDLAEKRLGIRDLTLEESKSISEQAKGVMEAKQKAEEIVLDPEYDPKTESKADKITRTEYGVKLAILKDYVSELKTGEKNASIKGDLLRALKDPKKLPVFIGNLAKSVVASFDNSFFLNQGVNALFDPKTSGAWFNALKKSFGDIGAALKGVDPVTAIKGEIYSRKNSLNGNYERMKLAIGLHTEEAIPTTIPEKIPVLGRFFKASNAAYNGAALRLRADIADMKIAEMEKNGINLKDKIEAESMGQVINAFTGRGDTGRFSGENVNALIFSVKLAKSKFDVMTAHILSDKVSHYAKKEAAKSLLRITLTGVAMMQLSEALNPGSTDMDPRSTNFGKIRIGKTWYPTALTFGGLPNLISRTLIPTTHNGKLGLWTKNGSGKFTALTTIGEGGIPKIPKYGATTPVDVLQSYVTGKTAPIVKAYLDYTNGKDFSDNRSTPGNVAKNLVTPITPGGLYQSFNNPKEEYPLLNAFLTALGSNASNPK